MRFMLLRKADRKTEAGIMPSQELLAAMGEYIRGLSNAGVLLAADGLQSTAKGVRVKFSAGRPTVIDGPFTETKEVIAGYCVIQVGSRQEAIDWVKRWPTLDGDGSVEIEIRQLFEAEDFATELSPELRESEEALRAQAAARHAGR